MADNGSSNDNRKVTLFPDAREREVLRKAHIVHRDAPPPGEPVLNLPPVVRTLCLANIAVFLLIRFLPGVMTGDRLYGLSFVPARYFGESRDFGFSAFLSPFTHMFIHAGWIHLAVNIGMLMAFGAGLEKVMGGRKLLLFYFATGVIGALVHAFFNPQAEVPMVGASGAISGLFGGVLLLMQDQGMMGGGYKKLLPFILVWIGISVFFGMFGMPGVDSPIAWTTHIGGFIAGVALYRPVLSGGWRR